MNKKKAVIYNNCDHLNCNDCKQRVILVIWILFVLHKSQCISIERISLTFFYVCFEALSNKSQTFCCCLLDRIWNTIIMKLVSPSKQRRRRKKNLPKKQVNNFFPLENSFVNPIETPTEWTLIDT